MRACVHDKILRFTNPFCLEADCANLTRDSHRVYIVMYTEVNASDTRYERSLS